MIVTYTSAIDRSGLTFTRVMLGMPVSRGSFSSRMMIRQLPLDRAAEHFGSSGHSKQMKAKMKMKKFASFDLRSAVPSSFHNSSI